jgi:hypothetical protein
MEPYLQSCDVRLRCGALAQRLIYFYMLSVTVFLNRGSRICARGVCELSRFFFFFGSVSLLHFKLFTSHLFTSTLK